MPHGMATAGRKGGRRDGAWQSPWQGSSRTVNSDGNGNNYHNLL